MAKTGNHGIVIPRDKKLLHDLYWRQQRSLPDIAKSWNVSHNSVLRVFRELDIPTRSRGISPRPLTCQTDGCAKKIHLTRHAGNRTFYGKRCLECRRSHYAKLARASRTRPEVKARIKRENQRSYYEGPHHPNGESQWLSRSKVLLRNVRRLCVAPANRKASPYPTKESEPDRISLT